MLRTATAIVLAASFCFPASADTVRTKSWFETHPDVSKRVNAICRDNPGIARRNPNCINAEAALESDAVNRLASRADREFAVTCASISPANRKAFGC